MLLLKDSPHTMEPTKSESSRRWVAVLLLLLGLLLLAGCLSGPLVGERGQEGPVSVNLTNTADEPYEFRVVVVDGPPEDAAYYPEYTDRESEWTQFSQAGSSTTDYSGVNVTSIRFQQNRTRSHATYTLAPGETAQTRIDGFETRDVAVVVVAREHRILGMYTVSCRGDLVGLEVTMTPNGTSSGRYCR